MKKLLPSALVLIMLFADAVPATAVAGPHEHHARGSAFSGNRYLGGMHSMHAPLAIIVNNMGTDTIVTDDQYSEFFKEDTAEDGVKAIIAAGNFIINGYAIPATEEECIAEYLDGYTVNETPWLHWDEDSWYGGKNGRNTYDSYDAAALATATGIPAGLEVRLYDTDKDGYADLIETQYLEALIASKIIYNRGGTVSVERGDLDPSITYSEYDGRPFDGAHFTPTSGEVLKAQNFDHTIKAGDIALFWYGPDGWEMDRAIEVNGIFVEGVDHQYYQMDDVQYQDAMGFSRDNVIISNRPGETANAHNYFGFTDNDEGLKIRLWLSPTTEYPATTGAPIGFTTNENAVTFLTSAIAQAQAKLDSVVISTDGTDVPTDQKWTTQEAYDELDEAIMRAETVLASETITSLLDYQVYLLYLTLHGGADDIGAMYAGYGGSGWPPPNFVRTGYFGFDTQIYDGTLAP